KPASRFGMTVYNNLSLTEASYTRSPIKNVEGNQVEYVPFVNWRAGAQFTYKTWKLTYQFSYLGDQYAEATNAPKGDHTGVIGAVPAYYLMDLSAGWSYK